MVTSRRTQNLLDIAAVLPAPSADEPAYDGSTNPQHGPLSPRQRDIICRLITRHLHQDENLNPSEIRHLIDARYKLDPRRES